MLSIQENPIIKNSNTMRALGLIFSLLILCLLCINTPLFAQDWQFVAGQYSGVAYAENGTALVVGERGIIMRSEDDGQTWSMPKSTTYRNLRDVAFSQDGNPVIVGDNGLVLRSENNGATWSRVEIEADTALTRIIFPATAGGQGFIAGAGGVFFRSEDGGKSWEGLPDLPETMSDMAFVDAELGFFVAGGRIYRTRTGGQLWSQVYEDTAQVFRGIGFAPDGGLGMVAGLGGVVLRTLDSGQTWAEETLPVPMFGARLTVAANGQIAVAGTLEGSTNTVLVRSNDSGAIWWRQELKQGYTLLSVHGLAQTSDGRGMFVTNVGSIYRTEDAWENMVPVTGIQHEYSLFGIAITTRPAFISGSVGILPNNLIPGGYVRTTDGGITWQAISHGAGRYTVSQCFSETGCLMVRELPSVFIRTTDAGETWNGFRATIDPVVNGSVWDMLFLDSLHGFQVGTANDITGLFLKTSDGGDTFSSQEFEGVTLLTKIDFVTPSTGWIGGGSSAKSSDSSNLGYDYGTVYRTTNGGETWQTVYDAYDIYAYPLLLRFRDEQHGFLAVGGNAYGYPEKFVLLETKDGGDNWSVFSVFDDAPLDIAFFNDTLWYAVGSNASLWESTDAGRTWRREEIAPVPRNSFGYAVGFRDIQLLPDGRTVIASGPGVMLRRVFPDRVTGVEEQPQPHEAAGLLATEPNPARDRLRITWESPVGAPAGTVRFVLYDVAGQEMYQETFRSNGNGRDVLELDVAGLASGVYQGAVLNQHGNVLASRQIVIER